MTQNCSVGLSESHLPEVFTISHWINQSTTMYSEDIYLNKNTTNASTMMKTNISNITFEVPEEMKFGTLHVASITAYSCFFVIAASCNLTVFITLFRNRHLKSRVNMFIMHLAIADLIVTFMMMPTEIGWHVTVQWRAGDFGCRFLMFFRTFGLYLSSFVLVVISLDRYFAILHPLSLNDADKRGKIMLVFAWIFSTIASVPQSVIFHLETHPDFPWFQQCLTFNFFPTPTHELVYNLFSMLAMYGIPLIIITVSYTLILREISKKTKQSKEEMQELNTTIARGRLRRSTVGNIERARARTLKMTIVIVSVFVFCWTPYFVMSVWWWFDSESAKELDSLIQKGLFMFAVSNSCMNPIVYGVFTINFKREFIRCCCKKSKWGQRTNKDKMLLRSGNNKGSSTRTSYSSVRASTSHGVRINIPVGTCNTIVRFSVQSSATGNQSPHCSSEESSGSKGACVSANDSRINLNNFISVQLPEESSKHSDETDLM